MSTNDGGPAYPGLYYDTDSAGNTQVRYSEMGMTLRDFFAAAALTGLLVPPADSEFLSLPPDKARTKAASCAYKLADAMIAERDKGDT